MATLSRKLAVAALSAAFCAASAWAQAPDKTPTPQQQRMKECNAQAGAQSLSGDKRKAFMSSCLKS